VTQLLQDLRAELVRRDYAPSTIRSYVQIVDAFAPPLMTHQGWSFFAEGRLVARDWPHRKNGRAPRCDVADLAGQLSRHQAPTPAVKLKHRLKIAPHVQRNGGQSCAIS
jgi:hypothetical protein